jgi:hypothetical protein
MVMELENHDHMQKVHLPYYQALQLTHFDLAVLNAAETWQDTST